MHNFNDLIDVLEDAKKLVALPNNKFAWSGWEDAREALDELNLQIQLLRTAAETGSYPNARYLSVLFLPTGPLQELSIDSGWGDEFISLADRFDKAFPTLLNGESEQIFDIWFTSNLSLNAIANKLCLREIHLDAENVWEWVIGMLDGVELDITRTHRMPAEKALTRIFLVNRASFSPSLQLTLVSRLKTFVSSSICGGRCESAHGDQFVFTHLKTYS